MSRFEDLLSKLCPNGVVFHELGDIGYLYGGLSGKSKDDFSNGNAKYITYMNIFKNIEVNTSENAFVKISDGERQTRVEVGDVLFTGSSETPHECGMSSVLTNKVEFPLYLNSFCFGFRPNDSEMLLPDFSKYLFRDLEVRKQIIKTASGVTRFNISKKRFVKIRIPVPPIKVQAEIARILDAFTELEEDLATELQARKQQFEYYRSHLFNFSNAENVKWMNLGDCIEKNIGGGTPSKAISSYWNGDIPWASVGDLNVEGNFIKRTRNHITAEGLKNSSSNLIKKGSVIVAVKIAPGKMKIADVDVAINQDLRGLVLHDFISNKYLTYYFQTINIIGNGTIVKGITVDKLNSINVPVPSLEVQNRIVNILDKFDTLIHDHKSIGLPAELGARQKQYDYYRSKLLKFQEAAV